MSIVDGNTATEFVVHTLREQIISGTRPGGSRLTEGDLAIEFDVSRLPVRRAVRRLGAEGLVDRLPNHTSVVHRMTRGDITNLTELHASFDRLAVRQAAVRRTDTHLAAFDRRVHEIRQAAAAGDRLGVRLASIGFRTDTYLATQNPILLEVHDLLKSRMLRLFALAPLTATAPTAFCEALGTAFRDQNPDAAEQTMTTFAAQIRADRQSRALNDLRYLTSTSDESTDVPTHSSHTEATPFTPDYVGVLEQLRAQILAGKRPPGSFLPERQVAEEFGVSRIPAGEAIEMLITEGLAQPGVSRIAATVRGLSPHETGELFDMSAALDVLAATLAAQRHRGEDIDILHQKLILEQQTPLMHTTELIERMFDFRAQVYAMAGNKILLEVNHIVESRMRLLIRDAPLAEVVLAAHRQLFEAIADRDTALAEAVSREVFSRSDQRGMVLEAAWPTTIRSPEMWVHAPAPSRI